MEIQESLGYLLNVSARLITRKMNKCLKEYDITTAQWAVLKLLDAKKQLSQAQIADELSSDRATIGAVIQSLQEKNYLIKTLDNKDRRSYLVNLTPKAMDIISKIDELASMVIRDSLIGIDDNEVNTLIRLIKKVIENLSDEVNHNELEQ